MARGVWGCRRPTAVGARGWSRRRRELALVAAMVAAALVVGGGLSAAGAGSASAATPGPTAATPGPGVAVTVPVGADPRGVAIDPSNHNVYVANAESHSVSVIDGSGDADNGRVTATINVDGEPVALAVDPSTHQVYVVVNFYSYSDSVLDVIDESGGVDDATVTAIIFLDITASSVAVDPVNHNVYLADGYGGSLVVVDESGGAGRGAVTDTIDVGTGDLSSVAVDPVNHNVYVGDPLDGTVSVIDESGDADSGRVTAVIPVGTGRIDDLAIAVDPTTHAVSVVADTYQPAGGACPCVVDESVSVIDEAGDAGNGTVTATIDLGVRPMAYELQSGVAVDPSTHTVYVSSPRGTVSVIDESGGAGNGTVTSTVELDGGGSPWLAVDPSTHSVYVTNEGDDSISVVTPPADLSMAVAAPSTAAGASTFTATATITDRGPEAATDTTTNLSIPAGVTVVSAPGATVQSGTLVWSDGSLAVGTSASYRAAFTVDAGVDATVAIGGVVVSALYDPDPADNAAITVIHLG